MEYNQQVHVDDVLQEFAHQHIALVILREIKSGKEATVYLAESGNKLYALKIYVPPEYRTFRNTAPYILGKHYYKPSHRKAMMKKNSFSKKLQHKNWVKREFFLLEKLFTLGASIPLPTAHVSDAILMEYLGDQSGPAPTLQESQLSFDEAKITWKKIVENINIFYQFGIVHGDLSAFNILWWQNMLYIIDFPQSIDIRNNPDTEEFLRRDVENTSKYFQQYFSIDITETVSEISTS